MSNLDDVLKEWHEVRQKKAYYEKQEEKYKEAIEKYLNKKSTDKIYGKYFNVTRSSVTRESMSKACTPVEVWKQYAKRSTFAMYRLTKSE
jgi:hypothetical protein